MKILAKLATQLTDQSVQCRLCPHGCIIKPGKSGICRVRENTEGLLYTLSYGESASLAIDPIEKKPLFHFIPGSFILSYGSLGCNMKCRCCQNFSISQTADFTKTRYVSPSDIVQIAVEQGCRSIAFTYNEPSIAIEYAFDTVKLARQKGIKTVFVTNGYISMEGLELIAPYLDAYSLDIKGFSAQTYLTLCSAPHWEQILENAIMIKKRYGIHIECVTNLIPGVNDQEECIKGISTWIAGELGNTAPWHITAFRPMYKFQDLPPTPLESLLRAREIGQTAGLKHIYIGNIPQARGENTYCPRCRDLLIERAGYNVLQNHLQRTTICPRCREAIENFAY